MHCAKDVVLIRPNGWRGSENTLHQVTIAEVHILTIQKAKTWHAEVDRALLLSLLRLSFIRNEMSSLDVLCDVAQNSLNENGWIFFMNLT